MMEEMRDSRKSLLEEIDRKLAAFSEDELLEKRRRVERNLLEFANYMEAHLALLYTERSTEVPTGEIIRKSLEMKKGIVLPALSDSRHKISLLRIADCERDLVKRDYDFMEPDPAVCKKVSVDQIDIAVIPGVAFDEKGGRLGFGEGFYNRLITRLPETTRKVSIAYEEQLVEQIQMESRKYNVDIIITDKRIIYKI
jgi:5-formyltetrahydrofolate cyclo-ligase